MVAKIEAVTDDVNEDPEAIGMMVALEDGQGDNNDAEPMVDNGPENEQVRLLLDALNSVILKKK